MVCELLLALKIVWPSGLIPKRIWQILKKRQTRQQSQIWVGKVAPKLKGTDVHLEENEPTNYTLGGVEEKEKFFGE